MLFLKDCKYAQYYLLSVFLFFFFVVVLLAFAGIFKHIEKKEAEPVFNLFLDLSSFKFTVLVL